LASSFAKQRGLLFYETSAKNGNNVEDIFLSSATEIMNRVERKEIDPGQEHGVKIQLNPLKRPQLDNPNSPGNSNCSC
jgi:hypothetical protein